jgi:hypothetical protein
MVRQSFLLFVLFLLSFSGLFIKDTIFLVGGIEEWGDLQWPLGELRYLDEHPPQRGHLHFQGYISFLIF